MRIRAASLIYSIEIERLNSQHQALIRNIGSYAHYSLGDLSRFKVILDNATGSAIWPQEVASGGAYGVQVNLSEDAIVEGADISDEQFLPRWTWHPKLTDLYVHNAALPRTGHHSLGRNFAQLDGVCRLHKRRVQPSPPDSPQRDCLFFGTHNTGICLH